MERVPVIEVIDSHCHLYDTRGDDLGDVLSRARAAGVIGMITVGCDAATTAAALEIASMHDDVHATVGLHPHEASNGVDTILRFLDDPNVIAVGEAGLDYYYEHSPRDVQRSVFAAQIQLAHERDLPLVIHTRDAWDETFDILVGEGAPERTIFHCFTGGPAELRRCLDLGAYVSFSGIVTFPSTTDLHEAARQCPADRRLLETDSPYLAPVPHRGRTNQPRYVTHVAARVAELCGTPMDEVANASVAATRTAFPKLATLR